MKLWKFCRGCVNIRIMGEYPERLVNRCLEAGIPLSEVRRRDRAVEARVSACDIMPVRRAARGTGLRLKILSRHGGARLKKWFYMNSGFALALMLLLSAAAVLSTRLWFITVSSVTVPEREIMAVLYDMGASRGKLKSGFSTAAIAAALDLDPRVLSARVCLRGVTLSVEITGREPYEKEERDLSPASIYAEKDCVIAKISVSCGRACVSRGQAVKKGDLLISGDLSDKKPGYFVRAEGEIEAYVLYRVSATAPALCEALVPSGREGVSVGLNLFGLTILREPFTEQEKCPKLKAFFTACPIPIAACESECRELIWGAVPDTREGTEARARLMAQEKLKTAVPEGAAIVTAQTRCEANADGSVTAFITVTASEKIGIIGSLQ